MDAFTRGYLTCALWLATDGENGEIQLDDHYDVSDFAPEAVAEAEQVCKDFQAANVVDLAVYYDLISVNPNEGTPEDYAGHDFWLTRNGHGAGFWDRGAGDAGRRLTDAAHAYGESNVYVGDRNSDHPLYFG